MASITPAIIPPKKLTLTFTNIQRSLSS
jgi:hypothetical protein